MPSIGWSVNESVSVADARDNRFLLVNRDSGAWCASNLHGLQAISEPPADKPCRLPLPPSWVWMALQADSSSRDTDADPLFVIYKLTDTCNYNCTYCYDKVFARPKASAARNRTIRKVLSWALEKGRPVNVLFHGGEPLIEFAEIAELVSDYADCKRSQLQFSLQTNASLLTQKIVDFILENEVGMSVSVDGHTAPLNSLRIFRQDEDAYSVLKRKISQLSGLHPNRLGLLVTIGQHNAARIVDALLSFQADGFCSVSFSLMQQVSDLAQGATPMDLVELFVRIARSIASDEINTLAVWTLIEWIRRVSFGASPLVCLGSPCGAGKSLITVYPSGEVGPCDSLFDVDLLFSDVDSYLKGTKTERLQTLLDRSTKTMEPCKSCDVAPLCNGTCPGNAILENQSLQSPASLECKFHYQWIRELMWLLSTETLSIPLLRYCQRHLDTRKHIGVVA